MTRAIILGVLFFAGVATMSVRGDHPEHPMERTPQPGAVNLSEVVDSMRLLADSLALGKTDADTVKTGKGIIESLNRLIELQQESEDQEKQKSAKKDDKRGGKKDGQKDGKENGPEDSNLSEGSGSKGGAAAGNAPESEGLFYGKGRGTVDKKLFQPSGDWGDLPPKEREKAMRMIEESFSHYYRLLIEQYFRKMAEEP